MIPVRILGTASLLPGRRVTTEEVAQVAFPDRDPAALADKTGIRTRHWADPDVPLDALAAETLGRALEDAGVDAASLSRIIVANCTGAEFAFPGSASRVAHRLGLTGSCDAFDVNNACMGFVTVLDLAARSVATGLGPVGLVSIELCSRHIRPQTPRPYLVFGDGVGAAVVGPAEDGSGILASALGNDGSLYGSAALRNANVTHRREAIEFTKSNADITAIALDKVTTGAFAALEQAGLQIEDVDWVLPHQPNGSMFDKLVEALGVDVARTVRIVDEVGSVGSSAIPISLDRLRRGPGLKDGEHVLMAGVGSGVSFGAMLYRHGGAR